MTKVTNIKYIKLFKRFLKVILLLVFLLITVFSGLLVAIQFPYVQTKLVKKASEYASRAIEYPITIDAVDISWLDIIDLQGVRVLDKENNQMIYLGEASVDFSIQSVIAPNISIDEVVLKDGRVNLYKFKSDSTINITDFIAAIRKVTAPKRPRVGPPPVFTIGNVRLRNMYFSYYDQRKELIPEGFDYYHFKFENINADVSDLKVVADTFQIKVQNLVTKEKQTQLEVEDLAVDFRITKNDMTFANLSSSVGKSYVNNYLKFEYNDINDLSFFNDSINVVAHLDSCKVYSKDLGNFAPHVTPYEDFALVSGDFMGKVKDFYAKNLKIGFGNKSQISGRASFKGLPEVEETYIDFKFNNSRLTAEDLEQYFGQKSYKFLSKFGKITGTGEFVGFPYDFVAHGKFSTGLGKFDSDLNFKITDSTQTASSSYSGKLKTYSFNLGKFLDISDKVSLIDMDGEIKGKGMTISEAEVELNANISKIGINNYNYSGIVTNAKLSNELFDGFISVNDPNLVFTANGLINLKENINQFDITSNLQKADLKALNITERETYLISNFDLNFSGLKPDEIEGEAFCTNTYLLYEGNKEIFIDSLFVNSRKSDGKRNFLLKSDLLSVNAIGNFEFQKLYEDALQLYKEYKLNLDNDKSAIDKYYAKKRINPDLDKYNVAFDINIKDLNNLFSIYVPGLYLSEKTKISGEFSNGYASILNCRTHFDTLFYKENEIYNADIEINTSKLVDSADVLAMVYVSSPEQSFKEFPKTEGLFLEGVWNNGRIDFSSRISQKNSTNKLTLNGFLSLEHDKQKFLKLENSSASLLDKKWTVGSENEIFFKDKGIEFKNFTISNYLQSLGLDGVVSANPEKEAFLNVKDLKLSTINPLIKGTEVDGVVNGKLSLKNIVKDLNIGGNINIDSLTIDKFLIGDVEGLSFWNQNLKRLEVNVNVFRDSANIIALGGHIKQNYQKNTQDLNLSARLNDASLNILNPLFEGILSGIDGTASGKVNIKGTPQNLIVEGKADVRKGRFKVDYLNTTYHFDDYIYLEENLIGFKELKLKDYNSDIAIVDGGIYHDSFRDFVLNIKGDLNNFHVLNTTEKDNSLFYGTAFVSGDIELLGAFNDFEIKANAVSNKGTKIYIPISETETVEKQNYIRFTSSKDKKEEGMEDSSRVDLSGIKMDFNFEITPDAYAEIIFDKRAGDIIRGYGSGHLRMEIDTRGDFFLYGNYYMQKGGYNFTLANLINKEFTINPNSSISWFGDPYKGVLDIDAAYHQTASLNPIIQTQADTATGVNVQESFRRTPVDVLLGIKGNLLSPDIDLGIKIPNPSPAVAGDVTRFESQIQSNEQELNRQVFSLLVLGGFAPNSSFQGLDANPTSNLSELLTNQLGNWLSQVDENLQIDLDLNGLDREALNTFNLRLSYTLLDGRLRISRDGRFTNENNSTDEEGKNNNLTNIAGEWTIEYLLTPEGKLRLKLFNKNTQNQVTGVTNTSSSAGFSLLHTQTFNTLSDLFKGKEEEEKSASGNNSQNPRDTTLPKVPKGLIPKEEELSE